MSYHEPTQADLDRALKAITGDCSDAELASAIAFANKLFGIKNKVAACREERQHRQTVSAASGAELRKLAAQNAAKRLGYTR